MQKSANPFLALNIVAFKKNPSSEWLLVFCKTIFLHLLVKFC